MHFEHRTIENTALPAIWLRRVDPQPQHRREHAYYHRQNALFSIYYTFHTLLIISHYSLTTTSQQVLIREDFA